jgi:hypothetical protein
MSGFDANLAVYSNNKDSDHFERARDFLQQMAGRKDAVICELMPAAVFLK